MNLQKFICSVNMVCEQKGNHLDLETAKLFIIRTINDIDPDYLLHQIIPRINANIKSHIYIREPSEQTKRLIFQNVKTRRLRQSCGNNGLFTIQSCQNQASSSQTFECQRLLRVVKGMYLLSQLRARKLKAANFLSRWKIALKFSSYISYDQELLTTENKSYLQTNFNSTNITGTIDSLTSFISPAHSQKLSLLAAVSLWRNRAGKAQGQRMGRMGKQGLTLYEQLDKLSQLMKRRSFLNLSLDYRTHLFCKRIEKIKLQRHRTPFKLISHLASRRLSQLSLKQRMTNILLKILSSKTGRAIVAFKEWKGVPVADDGVRRRLASKFEMGLSKISYCKFRESIRQFKEEKQRGNLKKKQAAIRLVQNSTSDLKKKFQFWKLICKRNRIELACKRTLAFFEHFHEALRTNSCLVLQNPVEQRKKLAAIDKIWLTLTQKRRAAFKEWRSQSLRRRMQKLISNQSKLTCLKALDRFLNSSKRGRLYDVIKSFEMNFRYNQTQRRYLTKLLKAKAGGAVIAFLIWKNQLPVLFNNAKNANANRFERALFNFAKGRLGGTIRRMKEVSQEGEVKKKECCRVLILKSMSNQRKMFMRWHQVSRTLKIIKLSKQVIDFMEISSQVYKAQLSFLFQKKRQTLLLSSALDRIFSNQRNNFISAWKKWLQHSLKQGNKIQNQNSLKLLFKGVCRGRVESVFTRLKGKVDLDEQKRKYLNRLLNSKAGRVILGFGNWKSLPNRSDDPKKILANRFHQRLTNFLNKTTRFPINKLRQVLYEGIDKKKRSVLRLINATMSGNKRAFLAWKEDLRRFKIIRQCKLIGLFLQSLSQRVSQNALIVFSKPRQIRMREWALQKLFENLSERVRTSYKFWSHYVRNNGVVAGEQQRKRLLGLLQNFIKGANSYRLKQVIKRFQNNCFQKQKLRLMLNKLLHSKTGKVILAFSTWKSLPQPSDNLKRRLAGRFESSLTAFCCKVIRKSLNALKEKLYEGENKKKQCIVKLVNVTMSGTNKYFSKWKAINQKGKVVVQCRLLQTFFVALNQSFSLNCSQVLQRQRQSQLKSKALSRLFDNLQSSMAARFRHWRELNRKMSLNKLFSDQQRKRLLGLMQAMLNGSLQSRLIDVVKKFQANSSQVQGKRRILSKLLQSKAGRAILGFSLWRSLPTPSQDLKRKLAAKFQSKLSAFVGKFVRGSIGIMREKQWQGIDKKKQCVVQISKATMSGTRRYFIRLRELTRQYVIERRCFSTINFVQSLNQKILQNSNQVICNPRQVRVKLWAIERLLANLRGNISAIYHLWHKASKALSFNRGLQDDQKRKVLQFLQELAMKSGVKSQGGVVSCFYNNFLLCQKQKRFFLRLLNSKFGLAIKGYSLWKTLPQRSDDLAVIRANRFESGIRNFANKKLKEPITRLNEILFEGRNKKHQAVIHLAKVTMSGSQKMFNRWNKLHKELKTIQSSNMLSNFLEKVTLSLQVKGLFSGGLSKAGTSNLIRVLLRANKIWNNNWHRYFTFLLSKFSRSKLERKLRGMVKMQQVHRKMEACRKRGALQAWLLKMRQNRWLKESVLRLAFNTQIKEQVALWRFKLSSKFKPL